MVGVDDVPADTSDQDDEHVGDDRGDEGRDDGRSGSELRKVFQECAVGLFRRAIMAPPVVYVTLCQ